MEQAGLLKWTKADKWLLRRCIGSVRGIQRFRSFMEGTSGEDLMDFWLSTERIMGVDESDVTQRDLYLSLLRILKATHLMEGSSVLTTCSISSESLLRLISWHPPGPSRRKILLEMQTMALSKIQEYWLPAFYTHCKQSLGRLEECQDLLKEYEDRLTQEKLDITSSLPTMSIVDCHNISEKYSSKEAKMQLWQTMFPAGSASNAVKDLQSMTTPLAPVFGLWKEQAQPNAKITHTTHRAYRPFSKKNKLPKLLPPVKSHRINTKWNLKGDTSAQKKLGCVGTLVRALPLSLLTEGPGRIGQYVCFPNTPFTNSFSLLALPPLTTYANGYLYTALSADAYTGGTLQHFLKSTGYLIEIRLLKLFQDLEKFLPVLLDSKDGDHFLLRQVLCERLREVYLDDCERTELPLSESIIDHLENLLCSAEAIPWIMRAQMEICKLLDSCYDHFLETEDENFLQNVALNTSDESKEMEAEAEAEAEAEVEEKAEVGVEEAVEEKAEVEAKVEVKLEVDSLTRCEKGAGDHLRSRMEQSLLLTQACSGRGEAMPLLDEDWKLVTEQDLQDGGSILLPPQTVIRKIDYESMPFEELALKNPLLAVERLSSQYRLFYLTHPDDPMDPYVKGVRWLSRGSSITEIFHVSSRSLLKLDEEPDYSCLVDNTEVPLLFCKSVEKLSCTEDPDLQRRRIDDIVTKYFKSDIEPEILLQTNASIIRDIATKSNVTLTDLMLARAEVLKSLYERRTKEGSSEKQVARSSSDVTAAQPTTSAKASGNLGSDESVLDLRSKLRQFSLSGKITAITGDTASDVSSTVPGDRTLGKKLSSARRGSRSMLRKKSRARRGSKGSNISGSDIDTELEAYRGTSPKSQALANRRVSMSVPGKKPGDTRRGSKRLNKLREPGDKSASQDIMDGSGIQRAAGAPTAIGGEGHGGRLKDHKHGLRHVSASPGSGAKKRATSFTRFRQKKVWKTLADFIRSVCKFRRAMKDLPTRRQFEDFLILQITTGKDIRRASIAALSQHSSASSARQMSIFVGHRSGKEHGEETDVTVLRRRMVGNRSIVANFLINDLYFYLEIEKFFSMTDAADVLMTYGMYQEADEARLRWKINMIIRQFLQAETLPKFRVNISDQQKDIICQMASQGYVERSIFHSAMITIFPLIINFWKRFCRKKALEAYFNYRQETKGAMASQVPDTHPQEVWRRSRILGPEEYPILRFTLSSGIQLILPREDDTRSARHGQSNTSSVQKNMTGAKSVAMSEVTTPSQPPSPHDQNAKPVAPGSAENVPIVKVREKLASTETTSQRPIGFLPPGAPS